MIESENYRRKLGVGNRQLIVLTPCHSAASVVAVFLLLALGCSGPPKHPTWNNATGAEQFERLMWQSARSGDWKSVEYHLSPTFVGVNAEGQIFDRPGWIQYWKTAQVKEFSLAEVNVQPAGQEMVVSYVLHLSSATGAPNAPSAGLRVISMWQQIKGGWTLVATSATPVR